MNSELVQTLLLGLILLVMLIIYYYMIQLLPKIEKVPSNDEFDAIHTMDEYFDMNTGVVEKLREEALKE